MPSSAVLTAQKKKHDMAAQTLTPGERLQRALELSELCRALRESGREAAVSGVLQNRLSQSAYKSSRS